MTWDMETQNIDLEIKAAVEELATTFEQFKEANDQRLDDLQQKQSADILTVEKVERLNTEVGRLQHQIDRVQTTMKRSGTPLETMATELDAAEQKQAFLNFVRKGDGEGMDTKAMSAGSDTDGGFMVPSLISDRIMGLMKDTSPLRQIANVLQVSTEALDILVDQADTASAWVAETGPVSETTSPTVQRVQIDVHELYAEPRATQKLIDDSQFNVDEWLAFKIAETMVRAENTAFVNGTGSAQPKGFLTYAAGTSWGQIEQVSTGVAGGWPASNPADILLDLQFALKASYMDGASWLMNRATLADVRKFKTADGQYIWQPALQEGVPATLLGYPVYAAEDMPVRATDSLSVAFGNFKLGYTIVDRFGVRMLRDPFTAKPYVKFYATKRVGGDVTNFEAIKLLTFSA